eukprot:jgi/Botrbrau1/17068/Bobra.31_2s0001.2
MTKYLKPTAFIIAALALLQPFAVLAASPSNNSGPQNGNTAGQANNNAQSSNSNAGNNNGNGNGNGNARGDPLIQAFDGTPFFFHGEPGKVYNLVSVKNSFQVAALLKEANNAVHIGSSKNGTYIQEIGYDIEGLRIVVATYADNIKVKDERLALSEEVKEVFQLPSGDVLTLTFVPFQKDEGAVVTISTAAFTTTTSMVPPGLDHAGFWQPSYLNFEIALKKKPTEVVQGVIGDTYHFNNDKMKASTLDTPEKKIAVAPDAQVVYPVFPDSAYELPALFSAPRFSFPASFIHEIIVSRKKLALRVASPAAVLA